MKRLLFLLALAGVAVSSPAATLSFERDGNIFIADADGQHPGKVAKGYSPDIASDGKSIAFNTESEKTTDRQIVVLDLAGKKTTVVKDVPSTNCYGPVWSKDGRFIAFQILRGSAWGVGVVAADGSGYRPVKLPAGVDEIWAPTWSADGKSLFCHDLESVFEVTIDGKLLKRWVVSKLIPDSGMNSGSRISASADGEWLFLDVDGGDDATMKDWDGPPPSIWKLNLKTGAVSRLTPPKTFEWDVYAAPDQTVLCIGLSNAKQPTSIYRLSLDGKDRTLLIKNGRTPSLSAQ